MWNITIRITTITTTTRNDNADNNKNINDDDNNNAKINNIYFKLSALFTLFTFKFSKDYFN